VKLKTSIFRAGAWAAPVLVAGVAVAISSSGTAVAQQPHSATTTATLATNVAQAPAIVRPSYVPGTVVVGYRSMSQYHTARTLTTTMGLRSEGAIGPGEQVLRLPSGLTVMEAVARLRRTPGVGYAVPDYLAHVAGSSIRGWIPNDPGRSGRPKGWEAMQWNFLPADGISVPSAWAHLRTDHRPGGQGVVVAIVDTGVAYRNWNQFRQSPDFGRTRFVDPHDFVANNRFPLDRVGHGTFVAGTVAESTDNHVGLTGIAYGASIMPVRVLNADGFGTASNIARGIRYAVRHGAQVINLSIQFPPNINAAQIPQIVSALRYARKHRVLVVAAAGNESANQVTYPARGPGVIAVGATTNDRCLARYSNFGPRLDLVAPGGGKDSPNLGQGSCHPGRSLPNIFQMTFPNENRPRKFGYPNHWFGTSMASPEVAGVAALVIASGVVGRHPTPAKVLWRLESTAQPLGGSQPNQNYGWGLVDADAATTRR
jgi:serine protease